MKNNHDTPGQASGWGANRMKDYNLKKNAQVYSQCVKEYGKSYVEALEQSTEAGVSIRIDDDGTLIVVCRITDTPYHAGEMLHIIEERFKNKPLHLYHYRFRGESKICLRGAVYADWWSCTEDVTDEHLEKMCSKKKCKTVLVVADREELLDSREFVIDSKACLKIAELAREVRDTPHRAYGVLAPYRPAWWHFLFCRKITSLKANGKLTR